MLKSKSIKSSKSRSLLMKQFTDYIPEGYGATTTRLEGFEENDIFKPYADLSGKNLTGANLSGKDLTGATLIGAN
ncbi:MAG: pentapeptide repeat-containing protein, partial [Acidimicrobiaceae bacterium]|nr:pentapeptide repeat-containing protein [Acidimicrobiaceae bacterium]